MVKVYKTSVRWNKVKNCIPQHCKYVFIEMYNFIENNIFQKLAKIRLCFYYKRKFCFNNNKLFNTS